MTMYNDDTLTAYLDGETTHKIADEISVALASDAKLATRMKTLSLDKAAIGAAFDPILGLAQTRNLEHRLECATAHAAANENTPPSRVFRTASFGVTLLVGVALGWGLFGAPPDATDDWRMEVAHYQALYVVETMSPIIPDNARLAAEFSRASAALDLALAPANFMGIEGLELRRAQVLGYEGAPLVQIAFTLPDGTPFAFCIVKKTGAVSAIKTDTLVGLASASWTTDSHGFLAIGGGDTSLTLALAQKIAAQL